MLWFAGRGWRRINRDRWIRRSAYRIRVRWN